MSFSVESGFEGGKEEGGRHNLRVGRAMQGLGFEGA